MMTTGQRVQGTKRYVVLSILFLVFQPYLRPPLPGVISTERAGPLGQLQTPATLSHWDVPSKANKRQPLVTSYAFLSFKEILTFPRRFLHKMKTFCVQYIIFFFYQNTDERAQWEMSDSLQNCYQGKISGTREQWENTSAEKAGFFLGFLFILSCIRTTHEIRTYDK